MEINVTPVRGAILVALLIAFYLAGGFDVPDAPGMRKMGRAWMWCIAMFVIGAVKVSIVDHWVGNVERSNIRLFYVILGVILMAVALAWQAMLRGRVEAAFAV